MSHNKLKNWYFVNEDKTIDRMTVSVNCFEKIIYFALRDYNLFYEQYFMDDLNLVLDKRNNQYNININSYQTEKKYFKQQKFTYEHPDKIKFLQEMIDTGNTVAFMTKFDVLPNYLWSLVRKEEIREHYCLLLSYNDEDFFYAEDPYLLNRQYYRPLENNPTIGKINKEELAKALEIRCDVLIVEIIKEHLNNVPEISDIVKEYVKNYSIKVPQSNNSYIGQSMLSEISRDAKMKSFELPPMEFDYLYINIASGRRYILKRNIEFSKWRHKNSNFVIEQLDRTSNLWKKLWYATVKNKSRPRSNFNETTSRYLDAIVLEEKILAECLSSVL